MLFNSYIFIAAFLPLTYLCHAWLVRRSDSGAAWFLATASMGFYAYWNPANLPVLFASIVANYLAAGLISRLDNHAWRRGTLALAIIANLTALGYYKYTGFLMGNLDALAGLKWHVETVALPLGISFFTFTQIAYLVDVHESRAYERNFRSYVLFVTFFPHLIAGPILHHAETMPQFSRRNSAHASDLALGLTLFIIGLFKKVVMADGFAEHARLVFDVNPGAPVLSAFAAWGGVTAYAFQLYFDFSGYSDMAIGLAKMFGIDFPVNFNSPYKAASIIDFWRRWHMTLSRFLRDYLYVPLGGNRLGRWRRHLNLMATMVLGGLWHGANWTFVVWGALHGIFLVINHAWRHVIERNGLTGMRQSDAYRIAGIVLTFVATLLAWVYFRAPSLGAANGIVSAMLGTNALMGQSPAALFDSAGQLYEQHGFGAVDMAPWLEIRRCAALVIGATVVWVIPNSQQMLWNVWPALAGEAGTFRSRINWRPSHTWAVTTTVMAVVALMLLNRPAEFLYFQF